MNIIKVISLLAHLIFSISYIQAQTKGRRAVDATKEAAPQTEPDNGIYTSVEKMPAYPGGEEAMLKFISDNFVFPVEESGRTVEGPVTIEFIITPEGKVASAQVAKSLSAGIDAELLRIVNSMPLWQPGQHKGKKVSVRYTLVYDVKSHG